MHCFDQNVITTSKYINKINITKSVELKYAVSSWLCIASFGGSFQRNTITVNKLPQQELIELIPHARAHFRLSTGSIVENDCNCSAEHIIAQNPLNKNESQIVLQAIVETWI